VGEREKRKKCEGSRIIHERELAGSRVRLSAAALIIYDTRNGIGRIRTYILYNNFQGLMNVYYLPRNVMASRPPLPSPLFLALALALALARFALSGCY